MVQTALHAEGSCPRFSPTNYPQLQNLLRKDPSNYYEEYLQQENHFNALYSLYFNKENLFPTPMVKSTSNSLTPLVSFLAHTAGCYERQGGHLSMLIYKLLEMIRISIRRDEATTARSMVSILTIARHKLIPISNKKVIRDVTTFLLEIAFFAPDLVFKFLMQEAHIASIEDMMLKQKITDMLSELCNPEDSNKYLVLLRFAVEMFSKFKHWQDPGLVQAISHCCLLKSCKLSSLAINFFLGNTSNASEYKDTTKAMETLSAVRLSLHVSKKSRSKLRKEKNALKKVKEELTQTSAESADFVPSTLSELALNLITDPLSFCEKLESLWVDSDTPYETKLLIMRLQSTLISHFKFIVPSFYDKVLRYLKPNQKDCTKILTYVANSIHPGLEDLIETEEENLLESVLPKIQNISLIISRNFVAENCRPEVITVGLNSLREIAARFSCAISKELLEEILTFDSNSKAISKNKGVTMATKSILSLYREKAPEYLPARFRGRPSAQKVSLIDPNTCHAEISNLSDQSCKEFEFENDYIDSEMHSDNKEVATAISTHKAEVNRNVSELLVQKKKILISGATTKSPELDQSGTDEPRSEDELFKNVSLDDIQRGIYPAGKPSKEERLKSVLAGREGREYRKGGQHGLKAKKNKKTKSFLMMVHKKGGLFSKSVKNKSNKRIKR